MSLEHSHLGRLMDYSVEELADRCLDYFVSGPFPDGCTCFMYPCVFLEGRFGVFEVHVCCITLLGCLLLSDALVCYAMA